MAVTPSTVLGKYRIIREIARSNDIVYEGVDPAMGRRVAIKELVLPVHLSGTQKRERIERFYREAKAAGTLSHPNIVTIYDVGQENERHFIAMEYLEGHSLREIQQMQGALPIKESLEVALQLCDALSYAHSRGIVHRDVKPDNVHILPGGIIKLTDFGIARITAEPSITAHGQVFGTPSYMSPEQVASHTVDHRTDIFSLGITLFEMLTGRKPFAGDSVITITYNIMNIQPSMPVGIPPGLHAVLQKALAKDVNLRYQNAAAIAADLRAEKFALESGNKTGQITGMGHLSNGGQGMLNTGNVPSNVSGIPAFAPQLGHMPQQHVPTHMPSGPNYAQQPVSRPYTTDYPNQPPAPQGSRPGLTQETRNTLLLILSVFGLVVILALLVWGITMAFNRWDSRGRQDKAATFYKAGTTAFNNQDYESAANDFNSARDAAPDSLEATRATEGLSQIAVARGLTLEQRNNPVEAETAFQQAIRLNPRNAAAFDNLGNIMALQHEQTSAIRSWEGAIKADPTSPSAADARHQAAAAYVEMGQELASSGNAGQARAYWQKAVDLNPGSEAANRAAQNLGSTSGSAVASSGR